MKLSTLQKHILIKTWDSKKTRLGRDKFSDFYNNSKKAPSKKLQIKIISRSLERLIDKGLLVGYGEKTQYKLYITQVKLSALGKKIAPALLGRQETLPFRKRSG